LLGSIISCNSPVILVKDGILLKLWYEKFSDERDEIIFKMHLKDKVKG
jgi:hypothetical protein